MVSVIVGSPSSSPEAVLDFSGFGGMSGLGSQQSLGCACVSILLRLLDPLPGSSSSPAQAQESTDMKTQNFLIIGFEFMR